MSSSVAVAETPASEASESAQKEQQTTITDAELGEGKEISKPKSASTEKEAESLTFWEYLRFGIMIGINSTQVDMDKYSIYFILIDALGCDFYKFLSYIYAANVLTVIPFQLLVAWISDTANDRQHFVLAFSLLCQFALLIPLFLVPNFYLCFALWQLRQIPVQQGVISVWKLVKLRVEVLRKRRKSLGQRYLSIEEENQMVGRAGNTGDLCCDIIELVITGLLAFVTRTYSFLTAKIVMFLIVFCLNASLFLLNLTITKRYISQESVEDTKFSALNQQSEELSDLEATSSNGSLTTDSDVTTADSPAPVEEQNQITKQATPTPSEESSPGVVSSEESQPNGTPSIVKQATEQIQKVTDPLPLLSGNKKGDGSKSIIQVLRYAIRGLKHLFKNRIVFFAIVHSFQTLLIYALIETPFTLLNFDTNSDTTNKTVENYCGGMVSNLFLQGAVFSFLFFWGSLAYGLFLVKLSPRPYFKYFYPFTAAFLSIILLLLLFLPPTFFTYIMIGLSQVFPYYLNCYNYYLFISSSHENYYGFVSGSYAVMYQVVYVMSAGLVNIPFMTDKAILILAISIYVVSTAYSLLFARFFNKLMAATERLLESEA